MQTFYVSIVFYNASLAGIKMTFLLQYYRILAIQRMRTICVAAMVIIGCWGLSQILVQIFVCNPIEGAWDKSVEAKCIPNFPQWYINAGGNIITDIVILILPLPVIGKLNLERPQKWILLFIFCLGFL